MRAFLCAKGGGGYMSKGMLGKLFVPVGGEGEILFLFFYVQGYIEGVVSECVRSCVRVYFGEGEATVRVSRRLPAVTAQQW